MIQKLFLIALSLLAFSPVSAKKIVVPMALLHSSHTTSAGNVTLEDSSYGLLITPDLKGLPQGLHGFHVHENPDCGPKNQDQELMLGGAAGGHLDPNNTRQHLGPYAEGHLGDLPPLYVDNKGEATLTILAPRLTVSQVENRSLMIHISGDNFSDKPEKLGGGGSRIACGVIK